MTSHKAKSGYYGNGGIHDDITVLSENMSGIELHVFNDKSGCMFSLYGVVLSEHELRTRGYGEVINKLKPEGYKLLGWEL